MLDGRDVNVPSTETRQILGDGGNVLATAEYVGGKLHGVSRVYSPMGTLIQEAHYAEGELNGPYRSWWDSGVPKEAGEYARGERVGEYSWYREDGLLWQRHSYRAAV